MSGRGVIVVLVAVFSTGCGEREGAQPTGTPAARPAQVPATTPRPVERTCPVCKQPVSAEAKYCRACGSRQP